MSDFGDIALRLIVAVLAGGALGLNRDLHGKPTGVRTLGMVSLGSALIVIEALDLGGESVSRVIQGIVTGIGFLGAGVIIRPPRGSHIHGLTTAACTWATACIGTVCGMADWPLIAIAIPLMFALLLVGGPLEKFVRARLGDANDQSG